MSAQRKNSRRIRRLRLMGVALDSELRVGARAAETLLAKTGDPAIFAGGGDITRPKVDVGRLYAALTRG